MTSPETPVQEKSSAVQDEDAPEKQDEGLASQNLPQVKLWFIIGGIMCGIGGILYGINNERLESLENTHYSSGSSYSTTTTSYGVQTPSFNKTLNALSVSLIKARDAAKKEVELLINIGRGIGGTGIVFLIIGFVKRSRKKKILAARNELS